MHNRNALDLMRSWEGEAIFLVGTMVLLMRAVTMAMKKGPLTPI